MGAIQPWHVILVVVVAILLFGTKRLPDATRSFGRSLRIFKAETKGMMSDEDGRPTGEQYSTGTQSASQTHPEQQAPPPEQQAPPPAQQQYQAPPVQQLPPAGGDATINGEPLASPRSTQGSGQQNTG